MTCSDGVTLHVVNEAGDSLVQDYLLARLCFDREQLIWATHAGKNDAELSVKVRQYKHYWQSDVMFQ